MKVAIINLGCKVNQCECDAIAAAFERQGHIVIQQMAAADVYVINTCAVTQEAEKKSRQCVARVRKYNPLSRIYVIGCASQNKPEQFESKGVNYIGGTADKMAVCDLPEGTNIQPLPTVYEPMFLGHGSRARENVKIEDGCNNFCSYCLVPYLRGRVRSRSIEDILTECNIRALNAHEIVLTGINAAAYGEDIGLSLVDLVQALQKVNARFRFGSLEANVITPKLLRAMKNAGNFCDHFHLSLQSGDDEVLKAMNRHYTTRQFAEKVGLIRNYFPQAAITTDIIVGFASETVEQFYNSLAFAESMQFAGMHVFPYSRRQGTKAYNLPPLAQEEMNRRMQLMLSLRDKLTSDYLHSMIGYELQAVTEHADGMYMQGHTSNYIKVYIPMHAMCKPNAVYTVRCLSPYQDGMLAEIV